MIALVRGEVAGRRPSAPSGGEVVVDVAGVGYRLAVSGETLRHVPAVGKAVTLHSHLIVRDDALQLYGFATEEERDLFLMLLGVQSVGPKVALAVLSGAPPRELLGALAAGDTARFQAVPGIGKRTAERIIVELREKAGVAVPDGRGRCDQQRRPARARPRGPARARLQRPRGRRAVEAGARRHARGAHRARAADRTPMTNARIQTPDVLPEEDELDRSLRPRRLDDFVGQEAVREQLAVSIEAAGARGEALDHVLLAGPPGLGKTSLAQIVAAELGVPFVQTAGPALERKGDVAAFLTALEPRAVFFVDEIHRLPRALEETFYPAMEDGQLPITVGQGAGARVVTLDLPPFTLVGATTRAGLLTTPLRDRFGIQHRLEHYDADDLGKIVRRSASLLGIEVEQAGARAIAARSRGTPRVANRLLKRVRDYAEVRGDGTITEQIAGARARPAAGRRRGPRPARPRAAACGLRDVRRRPRRTLDARRRGGGGAGHDRGRLRAVPAPARAARAHAARPRRDPRVPGDISGSSRRPAKLGFSDNGAPNVVLASRAVRASPERRRHVCLSGMAHLFICPNCGNRSAATDRTAGFRREPKGCEKCGFGFLFELLDDYYPAPNAAFFVCDREGRVIGCGRGSFELTGLDDERVIGRSVREVLGLDFGGEAEDVVGTVLEWGVRALGKPVTVNAEGDLPARAVADLFPAYDDDGGLLLVLTPAS